MREWNSYSDDITIDGNEVKEYTIRFKTTEYEVYKRIEKFFQRLIDESNSSEIPNNCEVKNYCDDCLYNDVCDNKEFFYACTSKSTISKMEQVDKDTNVRSKDCETCKHNKLEWFSEVCDGCSKAHSHYEPKTEHSGEVTEMVEPQIIACPIQDDDAWIYETEPQTERSE